MKAEITINIDIDEAFDNLNYMEKAECVSNFYDALLCDQQAEFIAQIIKDADDDVLIDEVQRRGLFDL